MPLIMTYDFDTVINRRDSDSLKWAVDEKTLPMWVADMDFRTAPEIIAALKARVENGVFGYTEPGESWYQAYQSFYADRHHFEISHDWLVFSLGVVPTISSSVRKLTSPGDNVAVFPPVYNIFYNSIVNNGRKPVEIPLLRDGDDFRLDFSGIEQAFSDPKTTFCIFCNPANPVGRIWTKEELTRLGKLAKCYGVTVLSDEIHCDLVAPGKEYVPFLAASSLNQEIGFACVSPTKAFNLAGIHTSAIIIPNPELRAKVVRQINTDEVAEPNVFSCLASTTALTQGREWLDQLRTYLFANRSFAQSYFQANLPLLHLIPGEATYLLWVDCSALVSDNADGFVDYLRKTTGLYVSKGSSYGLSGAPYFRMAIGCPKAELLDGLNRLKQGVLGYQRKKKN
jgi:cystathionine beta-lyase